MLHQFQVDALCIVLKNKNLKERHKKQKECNKYSNTVLHEHLPTNLIGAVIS